MKPHAALIVLLGSLLAGNAFAQADAGPVVPPPAAPVPAQGAAAPAAAKAADTDGDADGDGVADALDECPATPAGGKVLSDGCMPRSDCRKPRGDEPADAKGCAIERTYILHGVKFEFDSDRLTADAKVILKDVAVVMQAYPDLKFELDGHTCNMGSDAYNQRLSDRRATSAMAFLIQQGINPARMTSRGFGESKPVDTNATEQGREFNRRVELKVIE